jgi:asparagine synthase (glutamine-hydrolysing)
MADDPRRIARFERVASHVPSHRESTFAVALDAAPRGALGPGEIVSNERYLLALEGYLLDAAAPWQAASWLLERHARLDATAFDDLNGAYAFCLFDRQERRALLGACAFGRRDLYYAREDGGLVFASDLAELLALLKARPGLAGTPVSMSLLCGATYGGETLLKGVRRALPGARLRTNGQGVQESSPVPLPAAGPDLLSEATALAELDRALRAAVGRLAGLTPRAVVIMSAGVDSPLVAGYVKAVTGNLRAVTLSMPVPPDETEGAAAIARALGGEHSACAFDLEGAELLPCIDAFVSAMEEPTSFGLGLLMPTLGREVSTQADAFYCGVSADALFGEPINQPDDPDTDSIFHYMYREIAADCLEQVLRLQGPSPDIIVRRLRARLREGEAGARVRLPLLLQNGLMVRATARLARAYGVEAFFPYLDREVVDVALRLPPELRPVAKPLLRALARRLYPDELQRASKMPFTAYPIKWLQTAGRLGPLLDLLDERRTTERGPYRKRGLRRLVQSYRSGAPERRWNLVLWQLVVFELFCRRFVDADPLGSLASPQLPRAGSIP